MDRDGNLLEENRGGADRRHPRRHGVRDDEPAARRRCCAARRFGGRPGQPSGRSRARPGRSTTTPTRGSSASIPTSPWASGSASTRRSRWAASETGRARGAADLDGVHEGVHRRPAGQGRAAGSSRRRATSSSSPVDKSNGAVLPSEAPGAITRRSSPAPNPARIRSTANPDGLRNARRGPTCPPWTLSRRRTFVITTNPRIWVHSETMLPTTCPAFPVASIRAYAAAPTSRR